MMGGPVQPIRGRGAATAAVPPQSAWERAS
jgi:hypothetical protein